MEVNNLYAYIWTLFFFCGPSWEDSKSSEQLIQFWVLFVVVVSMVSAVCYTLHIPPALLLFEVVLVFLGILFFSLPLTALSFPFALRLREHFFLCPCPFPRSKPLLILYTQLGDGAFVQWWQRLSIVLIISSLIQALCSSSNESFLQDSDFCTYREIGNFIMFIPLVVP